MENNNLAFVGIFAKGLGQELPDAVVAVDQANLDELTVWIKRISDSYDSEKGIEGTAEGRIAYITEGLQEVVPCSIVTDEMLHIFL